MNPHLLNHINNLKSALLSLPATGKTGFEGLIGTTRHEISGVPFRLAGSGSQFGVDGKSAYEQDAICFEGKRYKEKVPRTEVLSKIAELSIKDNKADVWILGATSQITSQLADDARELGRNNGIVVLILDWSETELPPFAVAMAMSGTRVDEFLKTNISDEKKFQEAQAALKAIKKSQDFNSHANRIRAQCNVPSVGSALAQKENTTWLTDVFSNRKKARIKLGQPLSPGDKDTVKLQPRKIQQDELCPYLTSVPDEKVVCILGGEGNGKSWIVAQSWFSLDNKPLMIFMSPDDFSEVTGQNDIVELIIGTLIKQTGDDATETNRKRWQRRLGQWKNPPAIVSPRLIVVIDGINQRPKTDWARIIENIGNELYELGGRLIITARTPYFQSYVKNRLSVDSTEISIPEWTEVERDEILVEYSIKPSDLHRSVAKSLCNPRLLGIALDIFDKADVTDFEELSVSRLLFEHIRTSERDAPVQQPAQKFARQLQEHAQEILSRVELKQQDDLKIFENSMGAVADGRFYQPVDGDATRYSLKDEGLTLALGFAVIDQLRAAQRNERDLGAMMETILEPITALDDTADVILAALTVAVLEENHQQGIISSLVKGFAALLNPDQTKFPAFSALARDCPQSFMSAAHTLCLAGGHQSNFDWIQGALIIASKDSSVWPKMINDVHSWLSVYSLSPERGSFSHLNRDPLEKVQEERDNNDQKIKEKLKALSASEQKIIECMRKADKDEAEGDLSCLSCLAFLLLADKELAPFAESLLNWSLANALNTDHMAPNKDFRHLVGLNRVDWPQARMALLKASNDLRSSDVSTTGKWALVKILHATGQSSDGKEARLLAEELTKDRPTFRGKRLIEQYCATDPCDPVCKQSKNLNQTAEKYATINVSTLMQHMSQTSEDNFWSKARTGVARFSPDVAIAKHREFIADVLARKGFPLRQGLMELRKHNALLTIDKARELVKRYTEIKNAGTIEALSESDIWLASQYCLLLAFPFLDAQEQATILLSDEADENFLLDLMSLVKPLNELAFEELLNKACEEKSERKQYLLLALAKYSSVKLSANTCTHIGKLSQFETERVRTQALSVIAQSDIEMLLSQVVESEWNAGKIETENVFEVWYGSTALLKAAAKGLVAHNEALDRISPHLYGMATTMLNPEVVHDIAYRVDASIRHVAGLDSDLVAPEIETQIPPTDSYEPSMFRVNERPSENEDLFEALNRLSESNDVFEQRQRRNYDSFFEFKDKLTQAKASIVLDHLSFKEFEVIVESDEGLADQWYSLFMEIDKSKLPAVHNFVFLLAHALGKKNPSKAEKLFSLIRGNRPLVRFTSGRTGVELDSLAIWAGERNSILDRLRFVRLDCAATDHDLSLEVLAALLNNQHELLTEYIKAKLAKEEPAEIARGLMVAGFSDRSKFNDETIAQYADSSGFVGSAQKAAKYAYERNVWARHWFEQMCQTKEDTDFWCYTVLFSKIVDGRFEVWQSSYTQQEAPLKMFGLNIKNQLANRIKRWKTHRKKNLFGDKAPASIFLKSTDIFGSY